MSFIIPYLHAGLLPSVLFRLGLCASRKPWFCAFFFFLIAFWGAQHRTWHLVCSAHPVWVKGGVEAKMERTPPVLQHVFPHLRVASETMHMEASSLILQGSTELVTLVCMDTVPQEQQTTGTRGLGVLLGKNWWVSHSLRGARPSDMTRRKRHGRSRRSDCDFEICIFLKLLRLMVKCYKDLRCQLPVFVTGK